MESILYGVGVVLLLLLIALSAAIYWLSKSRAKQVEAELNLKALQGGKERHNAADKIMEEPVADEFAWLLAIDARLRDTNRR